MDTNSNESDDDSCGVVFDIDKIVPLVRGANNDGVGEDGDDGDDEKHDDETNSHAGKDGGEENVHEEVANLLSELQERLSALVAKCSHVLQLLPPDRSDIRVVAVGLLEGTQNLSRCVASKDSSTGKLACGVMEEHLIWYESVACTILRGIETDPNWPVNLPRQLESLKRDRVPIFRLVD